VFLDNAINQMIRFSASDPRGQNIIDECGHRHGGFFADFVELYDKLILNLG
jgi:hypothetical protein